MSGYMDEETANYIEVKQGGRHLLDSNQFEYRVTKKKPNKTYYQCIQRKTMIKLYDLVEFIV